MHPLAPTLAALAVASALALPATALAARASSESADGDPKELFVEGVRLYGRGYYLEALDRFTRSYHVAPRPKVLLNIGQTQLKLGREAEAAQSFRSFLDRAPSDPDSNLPELLRFANDDLASLKPRLACLVLVVAPAVAQPSVDGKPTPPGDTEVYASPGDHVVTALAAGYRPASVQIDCRAGQTCPVSLSLVTEAASASEPAPALPSSSPLGSVPPPTPSVEPARPAPNLRPTEVAAPAGELQTAAPPVTHTPALVAGGIGAALAVAAIALTVVTVVDYTGLPTHPSAPPLSPSGYTAREQSELTEARVADGLWAGTVVAGGVAAVLWLTAGGPPSPASATAKPE